MATSSIAERYRQIRGGWQFLAGLCVFILGWIGLNWFLQFDHELTVINLILSAEASISVALLIASQADTDAKSAAREQRIEQLVERIDTLLEKPNG